MSIAALVKTLLAAGVEHDVIVAAVEAVEVRPVDEQAERRRAADRERKRALELTWPQRRAAVIERDGLVCTYCDAETDDPHIDHIFPLSRGGSNDFSNLTVSCPACNIRKGARTPEEWLGNGWFER